MENGEGQGYRREFVLARDDPMRRQTTASAHLVPHPPPESKRGSKQESMLVLGSCVVEAMKANDVEAA